MDKDSYTFPEDDAEDRYDEENGDSGTGWHTTFVRYTGILLLVIGIWTCISVLLEAFQLYREPAKIERLAAAVEKGSNLDKVLNTKAEITTEDETSDQLRDYDDMTDQSFRLSYFAAWFIALMLLMLISTIGFSAIRTGNSLIFGDMQTRQLLHELVRKLNRR